jgi:CRISPR-associated DxTHG motif protein
MSSEEDSTIPKKNWGRQKTNSVILYLIIVTSLIIISVIIMSFFPGNLTSGNRLPQISTNKSNNTAVTTWTVTSISKGYANNSILKADTYVYVKNATGDYTIQKILLSKATGTHGFNYIPITTSEYILIGDIFSLDRAMYNQGSMLILTEGGSTDYSYCILYL